MEMKSNALFTKESVYTTLTFTVAIVCYIYSEFECGNVSVYQVIIYLLLVWTVYQRVFFIVCKWRKIKVITVIQCVPDMILLIKVFVLTSHDG